MIVSSQFSLNFGGNAVSNASKDMTTKSLEVPLRLEGGRHFSLYLLSSSNGGSRANSGSHVTGEQSDSFLDKFKRCLEVAAHQTGQTGLASSYVAVVVDDYVQKQLNASTLGKWYESTSSSAAELSPLGKLSESLTHPSPESRGALDSARSLSVMALQVHSLMDRLPKSGYSIVDVHWFVDSDDLTPPSHSIDLYGALLRMKEWHDAHIEVVTTRTLGEGGGVSEPPPGLKAWKEALGVDLITSCEEWTPTEGVVWRGALCFTEKKTWKQGVSETVTFPGLCLTLDNSGSTNESSSPQEQDQSVADLFRGVGVASSNYCPTHLQLLQVVDYSTVPLFWISPLHCQLHVSSNNHVTLALFKSLMRTDNKDVAFLMCLCQSDDGLRESHSHHGEDRHTSGSWLAHVSGLDKEGEILPTEKGVSPLSAYESGPLLLVKPHDDEESRPWSCDAWFLWRPEVIDSSVFVKLKADGLQMVDDCDEDDCIISLPLLTPPDSPFSPTDSIASPSVLLHHLPHELSVPPSDCAEMKALKAHEWIQRKMIRRLTTPDLMFGRMVAPPPMGVASISESISITDVLNCFTSKGLPVNSELSPIAMRDVSQVSRVHDPALSDISYDSIIASTPTSKRQYHGVHYCLSNEDASKDMKWTKIQQRCLISERAGHCSNVSTPRAERTQRESRRLKEVQLQNKKQQKMKEKEEGKKKDAESNREGEGEGGNDENKTLSEIVGSCKEGEGGTRRSKNDIGAILKSRRSLQFPRNDVRTVKSPTVKLTKISSRQMQIGFPKSLKPTGDRKASELHAAAATTLMTGTGERACQRGSSTRQGGGPSEAISASSTLRETKPDSREDVHVASDVDGGWQGESSTTTTTVSLDLPCDSSVAMECLSSVASPASLSCVGNEELEESLTSPLRRSPRLKERLSGDAEKTRASRGSGGGGKRRESKSEKKKEKSLKAQFGQIVVGVLKKNGVSRDHAHFKEYYTKLYNVSRHFLNDLKQLTGRKVVAEEIKRVVQMNVERVVCSDS